MKNANIMGIGGFTLIELLVVVLIIGILSAIAFPQYEVAVEKSRVISLLPLIHSVDRAQYIFFLENTSYSGTFEDLSIEMPAGGEVTKTGTIEMIKYDSFVCWLRGNESVYCKPSKGNNLSIEKYFGRTYSICWAESEIGDKVCTSIKGKKTLDGGTTESSAQRAYFF